jgi:hypothetical protein
MSYSAFSCVFIAAREAVPPMLEDDDGLDAAEREVQLYAASGNANLLSALRTLALACAPEALELFLRPWASDASGGFSLVNEHRLVNVLVDAELKDALDATDSIIGAWASRSDTVATLLAPEFSGYVEPGELAAKLAAVSSTASKASAAEKYATFKRVHEVKDLHPEALFAWLETFAAMLRLAQVRGCALIYVVWL